MEAFENILGKGKNAGNQHFLLFPKYFLPIPTRISVFELPLSSANAFNLDECKILSFGKGKKKKIVDNSVPFFQFSWIVGVCPDSEIPSLHPFENNYH